jgi:hypothetical protein
MSPLTYKGQAVKIIESTVIWCPLYMSAVQCARLSKPHGYNGHQPHGYNEHHIKGGDNDAITQNTLCNEMSSKFSRNQRLQEDCFLDETHLRG